MKNVKKRKKVVCGGAASVLGRGVTLHRLGATHAGSFIIFAYPSAVPPSSQCCPRTQLFAYRVGDLPMGLRIFDAVIVVATAVECAAGTHDHETRTKLMMGEGAVVFLCGAELALLLAEGLANLSFHSPSS